MSVEKKLFPLGPFRITPVVSRDLSKSPYISYYDPVKGRQRIYAGLSSPRTYEGRLRLATQRALEFSRNFVPEKSLDERAWAWLEDKKRDWRHKTYISFRSKLRVFLKWKKDREMSQELVAEFFEHIEERVTNGTRNDYLRYLKQIYTNVSDEDFFGQLRKLKHRAQTKRHYQEYQRHMIRDHLAQTDTDMLFFIQCIFFLLIRPGELVKLRVFHFEIDDGRVFIPAAISKNGEDGYVKIPGKFMRHVHLHMMGKRPNSPVFANVKNPDKAISYNAIADRYRKHMNELGFGHEFTLYGWKNSGAIFLWKKGVPVHYIQIHCRHSCVEITNRYLKNLGCEDLGELPDVYPDF